MTRPLFSALMAACALAAFAQPAAATGAPVSMAGIDLAAPSGAEIALRRLDNAARVRCGARAGRLALAQRQAEKVCIDGTVGAAVARLDAPLVTQMHYERRPMLLIIGP